MSRESWKPGNMLYPLPAVLVTCARPGERPNVLTAAWAGTVCTSPPMVSISLRPQRYSYDIIRETGEFVINLTTEKLVRAADYCGVRSGRDTDKFREMRLTPVPAAHVVAPLIEESPVNIECRVRQVLELGSHHMFLADVLGVDVDSRYLDENGKLQLNDTGLMVYSHGAYFALGEQLGSFGYSVRRRQEEERKSGDFAERREQPEKKRAGAGYLPGTEKRTSEKGRRSGKESGVKRAGAGRLPGAEKRTSDRGRRSGKESGVKLAEAGRLPGAEKRTSEKERRSGKKTSRQRMDSADKADKSEKR